MKDASGIKPAVSTPTRRQYWSSLRTMLSPQRFSLREEQFFLLLAVLIGMASGSGGGMLPDVHRVSATEVAGQRTAALGAARLSGADADRTGDRVSGDPIFSAGARQRRQPDQGRALHLRRLHSDADGHRQVHHQRAGDRQRTIAGAGRSFAANRRGHGLGTGSAAEAVARKVAAHRAGGRRGRTGRGVQRSDHGRAVRHRRSHRPLDSRHSRRGGALGNLQRGHRALVSGRRAAVPRSCLSSGTCRRTRRLCQPGRDRRLRLAGIRQVHCLSAAAAAQACRRGRNTSSLPPPDC